MDAETGLQLFARDRGIISLKTMPIQSINSSKSSTLGESPIQSDVEINTREASQETPSSIRLNTLQRRHERRRDRSQREKTPRVWKKILWVKQSYPDNYTDPPTFLSHLQWNPRVVQYDFWPLVADSTVIVQHVCSVVVFICCFVGIYQERVSPISIVGWGSTCTFICWLFWDAWIGLEEQTRLNSRHTQQQIPQTTQEPTEDISLSNALHLSVTETADNQKFLSPEPGPLSLYDTTETSISTRWQQRLATAKSAILIYSALLGISPILKSLTKSTTSDSIWAVSSWLLLINVFFYDYGGEGNDTTSISAITSAAANSTSTTATNPNPDPPTTGAGTVSGSGSGAKYQSSLSTNAALMASTVLASRLPSTTHVFSITLFSLEVFGLFPVFRRHLRLRSRNLHLTLTIILILAAGAGLGIVLSEHNPNSKPNPNSAQQINKYESTMSFPSWRPALAGALLWGLGNVLAMGACSWWLISLQKYKNVVIGPWDPARPIVRGR